MENQSPSIIAIDAGVAILFGLVMAVFSNPNISKAMNYLEGKGLNSQSPTPATGTSVVEGPAYQQHTVTRSSLAQRVQQLAHSCTELMMPLLRPVIAITSLPTVHLSKATSAQGGPHEPGRKKTRAQAGTKARA